MDKVKHKRVILINGKTPRQVAGNNRNCLVSREIDLRDAIDQLPDPDRVRRLLAVRWVRRTLAFLASPDPRSVAACDTAERFANGHASREELLAAEDAACDAGDELGDPSWGRTPEDQENRLISYLTTGAAWVADPSSVNAIRNASSCEVNHTPNGNQKALMERHIQELVAILEEA